MAGSRVSIYDVAARADVSTATVSRVVHDRGGYSESTRKAVTAAIEELRWLPSGSARALAERRAGIIGLLFADMATSEDLESDALLFIDQVIRGAERAATRAGSALLLAATRGGAGRERADLVAGTADGLVVLGGSVPARQLARLARAVPVVVFAPGAAQGPYDTVAADGRSGSRELTLHLADDHGHERIAFVGGPPRSPDAEERWLGFAGALAAAGLPVPSGPTATGDFTREGGVAATAALLRARRLRPTAIVYANDQMATGGLETLRRLGLDVPGDVAVVGFDDISSTRYAAPPLTTVRQPMQAIGEQAVGLLLDRRQQPDAPRRHVLMPTELVIRASCGCPTPPPGATS